MIKTGLLLLFSVLFSVFLFDFQVGQSIFKSVRTGIMKEAVSMGQNVTVAFATDHKYRYFTGVTLYSLIQHASSDTKYEIVLLGNDLTDEDLGIFTRLISGKENFTLTPLDMRSKIMEIGANEFYLGNYSIANYYRLFLPELLPQCDKIIYLDSDLIIQTDIKNFFFQDIGDFPLAAAKDRSAAVIPLKWREISLYCYCRRVLGIKTSDRYLNSGVLVMDLAALRKSDFSQRIRAEIASGIPFEYVDQDILNRLFGGRIYYLDKTWNYMVEKNERNLRKYKIVHISGIHPWLSVHKPNAAFWWKVAEQSSFADEIRKQVYSSSDRIRYLESVESRYVAMVNSTCWRWSFPFRLIMDIPRFIIQYISIYRNSYKDK